jgi:hypothetical protein
MTRSPLTSKSMKVQRDKGPNRKTQKSKKTTKIHKSNNKTKKKKKKKKLLQRMGSGRH